MLGRCGVSSLLLGLCSSCTSDCIRFIASLSLHTCLPSAHLPAVYLPALCQIVVSTSLDHLPPACLPARHLLTSKQTPGSHTCPHSTLTPSHTPPLSSLTPAAAGFYSLPTALKTGKKIKNKPFSYHSVRVLCTEFLTGLLLILFLVIVARQLIANKITLSRTLSYSPWPKALKVESFRKRNISTFLKL